MLQRKILSLSNLSLFESKTIFSRKIISKRKNSYCHGFMTGNFHIICGSMCGKNRQSPASTETLGWDVSGDILTKKKWIELKKWVQKIFEWVIPHSGCTPSPLFYFFHKPNPPFLFLSDVLFKWSLTKIH